MLATGVAGSPVGPWSVVMSQILGRRVRLLLVTAGLIGTGLVGRVGAGPGQVWPCLPGQTQVTTTACSNAVATIGSIFTTGQLEGRPSLAIGNDGMPVVSYGSPTPWKDALTNFGVLRVTRCGNRACTAGNSSTNIGPLDGNNSGWHSSIAIGIYGWPIVSSFERVFKDLYVTACLTAACDWNNQTRSLDGPQGAEAGRNTSLAIGVDGFPIIVHEMKSQAVSYLRVAHCTDAFCTAAQTRTLWGGGGTGTDIVIGADGRPLIAHTLNNGRAAVAQCVDVACSAAYVAYLDAAGTSASSPSIAIGADGLPVVSYSTGGILRVTHCGNYSCTAGNVQQSLAFAHYVRHTSLAIGSDGLPIIAHNGPILAAGDSTPGRLYITHCGDATCTIGKLAAATLDGSAAHNVGAHPSLAIGIDGLPIVAYVDETHGTIRVAKCGTLTCA